MIQDLKRRARELKREVTALSIAARDKETPWMAKAVTWLVAAYALSPIDLIPDFIPILGYLDDLILIPLGVSLAIKLIPSHVMEKARSQAEQIESKPKSLAGAVIVVLVWTCLLALLAWKLFLS